MKRILLVMLIVISLTLTLIACGGDETPDSTPESTPVSTPESIPSSTPNSTPDSTPDSVEDEGQMIEYVVNVLDKSGYGVDGAFLEIMQGETVYKEELITDADGVASVTLNSKDGIVGVKITKILSGSYSYPQTYSYFLSGQKEITIEVEKYSTYTVQLIDLFQNGIEGVEITLYNSQGQEVGKSTTDTRGYARFKNMAPDKYSATASYPSPAFVITTDSINGKYPFPEKGTTLTLGFVINPVVTYTVAVKNEEGEALENSVVGLYDMDNALVLEATTNENGIATFTEMSNGNYTAVLRSEYGSTIVEFVENGTASGEITVSEKKAGTEKYPLVLVGENQISLDMVELGDNGCINIIIPQAIRKHFYLYASDVSVLYNGQEYLPENGEVHIALTEAMGECAELAINPKNETELSLSLKAPGSIWDPYILNEAELDGKVISVSLDKGLTVYYKFVATADTTLTLNSTGSYACFYIDGVKVNKYPVSAGEEVVVGISTFDPVTGSKIGEDFDVTLGYKETTADYTATITKDGEYCQGITVVIYELVGADFVEVAQGITNASGVYVFEGLKYKKNYFLKVEYPEGYTSTNEYDGFILETSTEKHLFHEEDGTEAYPYSVNAEKPFDITVDPDGTVWLSVYVRPGNDGATYTLTVSGGVSLGIYLDSTLVAEATGSYTFTEREKVYKIKITNATEEEKTYNVSLLTNEAEAGATTENAIEFTESTVISLDATAGKLVYYRFFAENDCTVTVSLSVKDGSTLQAELIKVTLSNEGEATTESAGEMINESVSLGQWLYFAVSSEINASYEITITVE